MGCSYANFWFHCRRKMAIFCLYFGFLRSKCWFLGFLDQNFAVFAEENLVLGFSRWRFFSFCWKKGQIYWFFGYSDENCRLFGFLRSKCWFLGFQIKILQFLLKKIWSWAFPDGDFSVFVEKKVKFIGFLVIQMKIVDYLVF